jgi:hypothetical protein
MGSSLGGALPAQLGDVHCVGLVLKLRGGSSVIVPCWTVRILCTPTPSRSAPYDCSVNSTPYSEYCSTPYSEFCTPSTVL